MMISKKKLFPWFNLLAAKYCCLADAIHNFKWVKIQVSENYSDLTKWRSKTFKSCWLMVIFIFNKFKSWYVMC